MLTRNILPEIFSSEFDLYLELYPVSEPWMALNTTGPERRGRAITYGLRFRRTDAKIACRVRPRQHVVMTNRRGINRAQRGGQKIPARRHPGTRVLWLMMAHSGIRPSLQRQQAFHGLLPRRVITAVLRST